MPNQVLIDTSFVFALYNLDDRYHSEAVKFAAKNKLQALVPDVVLPEVTFLIVRDIGYQGIGTFLKEFIQTDIQLEAITMLDLERVAEITQRYSSSKFDLADCCIMALSERLNITQVCTFDRRDFSIFRPKHCSYLELLP